MQTYSITLLRRVKAHISAGGIIAYPTESCFGLGCDPFNYAALKLLNQLKGRNSTKGFITIASKLSQLRSLIIMPPDEASLWQYWPGPYTLLLNARPYIPKRLLGQHQTIAVRLTNHPLVRQLCNYLRMPLVSTSANYSGGISAKNSAQCYAYFGNQVMVLPGTTQGLKKPSTIIHWTTKQLIR